jgi:hypothetical protein
LKQALFFEAAGAVSKIGSSLNRTTIGKFSFAKSLKHTVGPEDIAIVKIRWTSMIFSATYKCIFEFYFNVQSGVFLLLHEQNSDSILPQDVSQKIFRSSFLVWILLALTINTIVVLYRSRDGPYPINHCQYNPTVFSSA